MAAVPFTSVDHVQLATPRGGENMARAGVEVVEVDDFPGVRCCHIHNPFGNRIELVAA